MRFVLFIILLMTFCFKIDAQQDHQVSHYMYDQISYNPGSVGSGGDVDINLILRDQWTGIDGGPFDVIASGNMPFKLFKKDHGIGISGFRETIGNFEDQNLRIAYAYRANIGDGKLGIGVGVNWQNRGINPEWRLNIYNEDYVSENDDISIPTDEKQIRALDVNFGLFYQTDDLYFGVSSTHINQSSFKYYKEDDSEGLIKIRRHYYLTSGYTMQLSNPAFELIPSVLVQSDLKVNKIDINTILVYNKKFWGGVSFRPGSSFAGMIGFEILNGAKIGFAYDFPTTTITKNYKTSYEVMVNYSFKLGLEKPVQKYKSVRFL